MADLPRGRPGDCALKLAGSEMRQLQDAVDESQSDVDLLGGPFGGFVRWIVQGRLKTEASNVLRGLQQRLESGEPASGDAPRSR